jgi:hypothetical protein
MKRFRGGLRVEALVASKRNIQRIPSSKVSPRHPPESQATKGPSPAADPRVKDYGTQR